MRTAPPPPQGSGAAAHGRPPTFSAYDDGSTGEGIRQQQDLQPLRRRGAPVPAPPSLLSTRSSVTRSVHSTPMENPYESTPTRTSTFSFTPASSGGTATTSPPSHVQRGAPARRRAYDTPTSSSTTAATTATTSTTASSTPRPSSSANVRSSRYESSRGTPTPSVTAVPTPVNTASDADSGGVPRSLSRRARNRSGRRTPTPEEGRPRVPPSRGPGSTPPRHLRKGTPGSTTTTTTTTMISAKQDPTIVRASTPSLASPSSLRSLNGDTRQLQSGTREDDTATGHSSAQPPHMRQETGVPSPSPALTSAHSTSKSPSERVVTAAPVIMSNAERKKAEHEARKQLRTSLYDGNIKVHGYVAQTAYAQKNPFRRQDFAEFAANPKYQPPAGFDIYSQAMATRVYGLEVSRASQGEFMMQRLVEAAHPATAEERTEMEALLSSTLEKLQVGDWFYKWTRINHVHQRYLWLNLQRGTLMWSLSPKQSVVLNAEIKLSTVTSITPDCLQLEAPMRVFYRMTINTPDRCISLATEIRKKFDVWYRVLLQLTAPNLVYGLPGVWGRPSSSVNTTGRGAASRWASRFSPLDAVMNDSTGHLREDDIHKQGLLSSSD